METTPNNVECRKIRSVFVANVVKTKITAHTKTARTKTARTDVQSIKKCGAKLDIAPPLLVRKGITTKEMFSISVLMKIVTKALQISHAPAKYKFIQCSYSQLRSKLTPWDF